MFPTKRTVILGGGTYKDKVLATDYANLIGYWRCNEASGTDAADLSSQGNTGTYSGVTLGQPGADSTGTSMYLDGSSGFLNIYTIAGEFVPTAITMSAWIKDVGDATTRTVIRLRADNSNLAIIFRHSSGYIAGQYIAGGTSDTSTHTPAATITSWIHVAQTVSVSGDANTLYVGGVAQTPATSLGTWAGALAATTAVVGNNSSGSASQVWYGWIQDVAVWKSVLTPAQVANLAVR